MSVMREARRRERWSLRKLAAEVGCSHQYLNLIERGKAPMTEARARKISEVLKCDVSSLLPGAGQGKP